MNRSRQKATTLKATGPLPRGRARRRSSAGLHRMTDATGRAFRDRPWSSLELVGLAGILLLGVVLFPSRPETWIPQARVNLAFVERPTLFAALASYPKLWPPGYPLLLRPWARLGADPLWLNALLWSVFLALFVSFQRRVLPFASWFAGALAIVVLRPIYVNMVQCSADTLFMLLCLLTMIRLCSWRRGPTWAGSLGLGIVVGCVCFTRYYGILWTLPLVLATTQWELRRRVGWGRAGHALLVVLPTILLVAPWMAWALRTTGTLTGMARTGTPEYPEKLAHWAHMTGFFDNLFYLAKACAIDFFSPDRVASHSVLESDLPLWEAVVLVTLLGVLLGVLTAWCLAKRRDSRSPGEDEERESWESCARLPTLFGASYLGVVIVVWTIANNDPIYTRFLFPSYPFLLLAFVLGLERQRRSGDHRGIARFVPWTLPVAFVAANVLRWLGS